MSVAFAGEWLRRVGYLLRRRAMEDELRREMEAHRAMLGEPASFGNTLRLRDEAKDAWGWRWLDDVTQDVRFAWRTLRHSPGFAATAIVTLALGIGVNSGMFSVASSLLLRPLYDSPSEVVGVYVRSVTPSGAPRGMSYPDYLDLRDATRDAFVSLAAASTQFVGVDTGDGAKRTLASAVTANYFGIFEGPLALGRPFTAEEDRLGANARVAILSHALWEQRGSNSAVIGQTVRVNGEPFTVIGVAARGFTGTGIPGPDLWLPIGARDVLRPATSSTAPAVDERTMHDLSVVGRVAPGVASESIPPRLATVAARLAQSFPSIDAGYTLQMAPPVRLLFMPVPTSGTVAAGVTALLMILPGMVLLVACLNLADLLVARGHVRRQELAIRSSLGGGRGRLTRQLLTEGLLLAMAGGALGLALSTWTTRALLASLRPVLPVAVTLPLLDLDWRVVLGTLGFSLFATLVFGGWPAWALTGQTVTPGLKQHGQEETRRPGAIRVGSFLVVCQVALSIVLLASAGLFVMSAISAATVDPGFRLDGGLVAEIDPGLVGYDEARGRAVHLALVDRLRSEPGIAAATIGAGFPFTGSRDDRLVAPVGGARSEPVAAVFDIVGRDYARVLGLPLLAGRDFSAAELEPGSQARVAIVDDALAQSVWPAANPLGQLLRFVDEKGVETEPPLTVVGMIPAVKQSLATPQPGPHVYVPLGHHFESAMTLQLRLTDPNTAPAMMATIARVIHDVDPQVPVLGLETWRDHIDGSFDVLTLRAAARMCAAFGMIALLLAVIGVYGVKSYLVSRRTREFGIRIATGAQPRALVWQVMREGGRITTIGIAIGLVLALGAGQVLQGMLYGVNSVEPIVLATAPLILLAASLLASLVPALRAMRVDPTVALRSE